MMNITNKVLTISLLLVTVIILGNCKKQLPKEVLQTDVLIVGGGASGTMAGIQAARMGVNCLIVEETPWLGGMLTSAGVSAVDGNYRLYSGLWEEFRQQIYSYYGGADSVKTGWVSNVLFEPQVGQQILTSMTGAETLLQVMRQSTLDQLRKTDTDDWVAAVTDQNNQQVEIAAKIVIDATELGDVAKLVGVPYDIGMDARNESGEDIAPEEANDIIQDLTYVAILKDYGDDSHLISDVPNNYDPSKFYYTCASQFEVDQNGKKLWDCDHMMKYGKLPNDYYMINWPIEGNDYYINILEMDKTQRDRALQAAKDFTMSYVYYLQHELGYANLALADDVYDTPDLLPYIPYHRESRRIKGLVRYTVNDMARPYQQKDALYRTGIAVGDYPVDHHHQRYPEADQLPELHFYPVPSYNLPLGTLIPDGFDGLIVAEKSISVSNIVNGTTRLQPVCMLIGQAAGTVAALAVQEGKQPKDVGIRTVQNQLIESGAYIMPYSDIKPQHKAFLPLQRIGATGILQGEGKNIGWENHTHIYPDSLVSTKELKENLKDWLPEEQVQFTGQMVDLSDCVSLLGSFSNHYQIRNSATEAILKKELLSILKEINADNSKRELNDSYQLTRGEFAIILDKMVNPFELREVNHHGYLINSFE